MSKLSHKIILVIFVLLNYIIYGQTLNDDIKFDKLNSEEKIYSEKIKNLLSKSKIFVTKKCSPNSGSFAVKNELFKYCIEDIIIIYVYEGVPILIDTKKLYTTRAYISDGTEKSQTSITKSRVLIKDWSNQSYFGKEINIYQSGTFIGTPSLDISEIESIIYEK